MRSSNIERLVKYKNVDQNLRNAYCEIMDYEDVEMPDELRFPFENFLDFKDFATHILYDTSTGIEETLSEVKNVYSKMLKEHEVHECGEVLVGSYYSLYTLEKISDSYYYFKDDILKSEIKVLDMGGELKVIEEGTKIFARFLILDEDALPASILFPLGEEQAEDVRNIIFSLIRESVGNIYSLSSAKSVLKTYGAEMILEIFTLFLGDVYDFIKEESAKTAEEIQRNFFDKDFSFDKFLNKSPGLERDFLQNILEMIYFSYLEQRELSFNDKIDFEDLFFYLLENNYFYSIEDAKKIKDTLINLYNFMGAEKYEDNLKSLYKLEGKIFEFNSVINEETHKYFDREVVEIVKGQGDIADILIDYQIFRQYSFEFPFYVKTDLKNLYQETLVGLDEVLQLQPVKNVMTLKNHHYPKIKTIFDFTMEKGFYDLDGTTLEENEKYLVYNRMTVDEKFATLILAFIKYLKGLKGAEQKRMEKLIETLLNTGSYVDMWHIDMSFEEHLAREMEDYSIVESTDGIDVNHDLTDMGRIILEFYFRKPKQGSIIEFPKDKIN